MSTTLTNGLKLPDKGSVDWYADMQSNYTILDGAVGTVAEYTSALAGKAGLTADNTFSGINSFSKHQIFQAGAYFYNSDSTAATSGLNLRNSKVTKGGTSDSGSQIIQFLDKDNKFLSQVTTAKALSGTTQLLFTLGNIDSNNNSITGGITFSLAKDGTKQFIPGSDSTHNLGNGSYQWNNLYAKNYYYNGTAWGLDKANEWSANNKFTDNVSIEKNSASPTASSDTSLALTGSSQYIFFRTKGSSNYRSYNSFIWGGYLNSAVPYRYGRIRLYRASAVYGETGEETPDTSFSFIDVALHYKWVSLTDNVRFINDGTTNACEPLTNNATDLGTSGNKWKSLNGINPGALSLPSGGTTENTDWYNVAGDILPTGENATSFNRDTANYFTPAKDGWLSLAVKNCSEISVWSETLKYGVSFVAPDTSSNRQVVVPVVAGISYQVRIAGNSWVYARLIMPKGNV